jgi:mannose/cellobiose epimerase-like protein (N-acyl-D-glucosamine 2-epimerase family)
MLRKELDRRLERAGHQFEWVDIMLELKVLQNAAVGKSGCLLLVRTAAVG